MPEVCTGELHSLYSDRTVSMKGREVISERECTRDAEWKLLHVTLQLSSSCQEASFCLPLNIWAQMISVCRSHHVRTTCKVLFLLANFCLHHLLVGSHP